ncbi:hypothetical protein ACS0TY_016985 [Phlomoides rotata]
MFAGLDESVLAMNLNFVFTGGEYNGSSLCILGRNPIDSKNRELPVVGGTSVFRMESGFSISNTYSYDPVENYGVLEYIVYVSKLSSICFCELPWPMEHKGVAAIAKVLRRVEWHNAKKVWLQILLTASSTHHFFFKTYEGKPNCQGTGAACFDPRFIGADGAVFYFHGKSNEHFTLVSDKSLHINAHFIGHRPTGRPRDYTWIQALGVLYGAHNLSVEATKASTWDSNIDHLKFTFDDNEVVLPQGDLSSWKSKEGDVSLERVSNMNSVIISIPEIVEIGVNTVPITKEDDRIHNYQIPSNDCFSHLEVQFRFFGLSPQVEGVLGRTYRPEYESHTRLGIAMPVVGGEDKYRTTSLFAADCKSCIFTSEKYGENTPFLGKLNHGMMDCSGKFSGGNGIICKK